MTIKATTTLGTDYSPRIAAPAALQLSWALKSRAIAIQYLNLQTQPLSQIVHPANLRSTRPQVQLGTSLKVLALDIVLVPSYGQFEEPAIVRDQRAILPRIQR